MNQRRKLFWLIGALSLIGFADAVYLTAKHYLGGSLNCFLVSGCDTVTTSAYATWGPLPVALLGTLFYVAIFLLVLLYLDRGWALAPRLLFWLALVGFLDSLHFIFVQAFVLRAWCIYCLLSAVIATLIFLCTLIGRFQRV